MKFSNLANKNKSNLNKAIETKNLVWNPKKCNELEQMLFLFANFSLGIQQYSSILQQSRQYCESIDLIYWLLDE